MLAKAAFRPVRVNVYETAKNPALINAAIKTGRKRSKAESSARFITNKLNTGMMEIRNGYHGN
jgi:hypothetical protein